MTFAECIPYLLDNRTVSRKSYGEYYDLWALSLSQYKYLESVLRHKYDLALITRQGLEADDWEVTK